MKRGLTRVGVVMSGVEPLRLKVLLLPDFLRKTRVVWNAFVKVPYKDGFAVGVIVNYKGINAIYEDGLLVKQLAITGGDEDAVVQYLKQKKEYFEADVTLLSAFGFENGKVVRVPINVPVDVGAEVYKLENEDLTFLYYRKEKRFYYLGKFFGEEVLQPLHLEDFQTMGEAFHYVIAGQTGSGKSTLASMVLCLYALSSVENQSPMNFVVLSPVPEFVNAFSGKTSNNFGLNLKNFFTKLGYQIEVYDRENLAFDRWEVLEELLHLKGVFNYLEVKSKENKDLAVNRFIELVKKRWGSLKNFTSSVSEGDVRSLLASQDFVNHVYKLDETRARLREVVLTDDRWKEFWYALCKILYHFIEDPQKRSAILGSSFQGKPLQRVRKISDLAEDVARREKRGRVVVLDLEYGGDLSLQCLLLKEVVDKLRHEGERQYRADPSYNLNTLVVLDEAHNFAPRAESKTENDFLDRLKTSIAKAFAETRKFGLGWMAITTRLSLIDRRLYEHARIKIVGYGLTTGMDRDLLREEFGKEVLERYSTFADPSDPLAERTHNFLVYGPITVLSKEPELIQAFKSADEFLRANEERVVKTWPLRQASKVSKAFY